MFTKQVLVAALSLVLLAGLAGSSTTARADGPPSPAALPAPEPALDGKARLAAVGPVTLRWTNPVSTRQYEIRVTPYGGDGPGINLIVGDAALVASATYVIQAPVFGRGNYVLLPGMTYFWQVRATTASWSVTEADPSWGPWSETWSFRTPAASSGTISPASPSDDATLGPGPVTLQWRDTAGDIFYYEIQVSSDPLFRTGAGAVAPVWWLAVHGAVSAPLNSWTTPALPSGAAYYWRVRPRVQGDATPLAWGPSWRFSSAGGALEPYPREVLDRINQVRQSSGLIGLSENPEINAAAKAHSDDMAANSRMDHTGSDGSSPGDRLTMAGYPWRSYGEIIAAGYSTAAAVVEAWMNSAGHREIMLTPGYREFGGALSYSSSGRSYWTVDFGAR